jgi:ABC-type phosphate transport system permease subunit
MQDVSSDKRVWVNLDRVFAWIAQGAAILTLALLAGIILSLVISAWPAIEKYGFSFLTRSVWDPVQNEYGGLVMIWHASYIFYRFVNSCACEFWYCIVLD